ncbi:MAG: class I SAM-dependent methyltransferase [Acidobacteria bacterium]|nr:class I SAM-dependent methyltransferase [Acidobacteriota bacterium]
MAENVVEKMREDWNARAREDANYYVAFGRRDQEDDEFQSTAAEVVHGLEWEMRRLPAGQDPRNRRALEIGCGPGRLLRPMAAHFGEIHGVDISDEMVARARQRLAHVPHAHAHVARNSNLEMFAGESFDFAYSYAVFQHIPSRDVVLGYLKETWRVLKPGGYMRCQINGLPESAARYDTWSGVRIGSAELEEFCRANDFQMLSLEGTQTQYMWTTLRKRPRGWYEPVKRPEQAAAIRRITNAQNSEPVAPARGRFAALSLWVENLPDECDLLNFEVRVGNGRGTLTYIGPREYDGMAQVNLRLPFDVGTGLQPVTMAWRGEAIGPAAKVRIVPQPALVPRVLALSDGINLMSGPRIVTRSVKVTLEEVVSPEEFSATVDGRPVVDMDFFCTDPLPPRFEVNFKLPDEIAPGGHSLEMKLGKRVVAPVGIDVV